MLYEFYKLVPEGVMAVPYSCELTVFERSEFARVGRAYKDGVATLAKEGVDAIYVGGTPVQLSQGTEHFEELVKGLRRLTDIPIVTSAEAERAALREIGAGAFAILTPHEDSINKNLHRFLDEAGVQIGQMRGMGYYAAREIALVSDYLVYREVVRLARDATSSGAVHITCPRWPTVGKIAEMEESCAQPVTSSCQASLWQLLSILHIRPREGRWGSLLTRI